MKNTSKSRLATKVLRVQHSWWKKRVASACILALMAFALLVGLRSSVINNDPPWPAPTAVYSFASFL